MNAYQWASTIALAALVLGAIRRRHRPAHVACMATAILLDVTLLLVVELNRGAIGTVAAGRLNPWQWVHVAFSTVALILYLPLLFLGIKQVGGDLSRRTVHMRLGVSALSARFIGYVFMFSMGTSV